jgi:hypothetical protein
MTDKSSGGSGLSGLIEVLEEIKRHRQRSDEDNDREKK